MHYQDPHPSTSVHCDDVILKAELRRFGFSPGPIVDSTRNLYIKKLEKLKKEFKSVNKSTRKSLNVNFQRQKGCTCSTSSTTTPIAELKSFEIITNDGKPMESSTQSLYIESPEEVKKGCKCVYAAKSSHSREQRNFKALLNPEPSMANTRSLYKYMEELQKESTSSLPSATIVTIDLTKEEFNTEPVVDSTKKVYMDRLEELNKGTKCDNVDKPTPPLVVNQTKACTCSTPSTTTSMAELKNTGFNSELIRDNKKNLEAPKKCLKGSRKVNVKRLKKCTSSTPSTDTLVAELRSFGYNPGPILDSTKNLYIKKLEQLKQAIKCDKKKKLGRSLKALKANVEPPKKRTSSHSRPTIPTGFGCNSEPKEDNTKHLKNNELEKIKKGSKCDNVDELNHLRKTLQVNVTQTIECTCCTITQIAEFTKLNSEPIVHNTRSSLMKRSKELKKGIKCDNVEKLSRPLKVSKANVKQQTKSCRDQIEKYLLNADWMRDLRRFIRLEKEARQDFIDASKGWSSGNPKKSFIYLLLDPRITKNLPVKLTKSNKNLQWTTFISSIFYVGTGENEGPYKHLIEARALREKLMTSKDKKVQLILDIWKDDMGVICLQVFHNVIPNEAYTYEAAMIDALGIKNLTNLTSGSYKGVVESWAEKKQSMLGVYLLYKAMQSYLHEGERQLRPNDI